MTDEPTPKKKKRATGPPQQAARGRKRSTISPPHGDALGQAHPEHPDVPVHAEPARPGANRAERVARRAFELYAARRGSNGDSLQDWLEAERQIDAELAAEVADRSGR